MEVEIEVHNPTRNEADDVGLCIPIDVRQLPRISVIVGEVPPLQVAISRTVESGYNVLGNATEGTSCL